MGKRKRRSQQAKTQRAAGQGCFGSAFTDDPFDDMIDPDFEPTASEDEDDSGNELDPSDHIFSMVEGVQDDESDEDGGWTDSDDEESDEEGAEVFASIEAGIVEYYLELQSSLRPSRCLACPVAPNVVIRMTNTLIYIAIKGHQDP